MICADRDRTAAEETASWITGEGGTASVVEGDVTKEEDCARIVSEASATGLDGLVLNVGIGRGAGIAGTSAADWDTTFSVNLRGHFLVVKEALRTASRKWVRRVHQLGRRPATGEPASGLRQLEGGPARAQPPCRPGRRPAWHPCERRRSGSHRHAARTVGLARSSLAGSHPGPARTPRHGVGDRVGGRLPAVRRSELHHRTNPGGRRGPRPHLISGRAADTLRAGDDRGIGGGLGGEL